MSARDARTSRQSGRKTEQKRKVQGTQFPGGGSGAAPLTYPNLCGGSRTKGTRNVRAGRADELAEPQENRVKAEGPGNSVPWRGFRGSAPDRPNPCTDTTRTRRGDSRPKKCVIRLLCTSRTPSQARTIPGIPRRFRQRTASDRGSARSFRRLRSWRGRTRRFFPGSSRT